MIGLVVVATLIAVGLGFGSAGVPGAITGMVAAVGTGSGFAIFLGSKDSGVSLQPQSGRRKGSAA